MSDTDSPPKDGDSPPEDGKGEKEPDKKRRYRRLVGLGLKAALGAGLRVLFEKFWE
ncbi:hypothetical protein [Streptomyces sp. NPDC020489]|uniref:hypothetical protein n=1 Tax=Streptomyces sp. NPDC020489 TaxID=3365077 RepID=UPI0037ABAA5E